MDTSDAPKPKRKGLTREQRRNISDGLKRLWSDPAYRERVSKAIREGMARKKKQKEESQPQQKVPRPPNRNGNVGKP